MKSPSVIICSIIPAVFFTFVNSSLISNCSETATSKKVQYPRAFVETVQKESSNPLQENCVKTLFHIKAQHFLSADCCFTKMCPVIGNISARYPHIKELLLQLCSERFYLKELLDGCRANNNTNFNTTNTNKENSSAITNCSANFQPTAINDETAQINSEITGDFRKGSAKTVYPLPMSASFKSGPNSGMSNYEAEDEKIRFENVSESSGSRDSALQFLEVPRGDDMRIHDLRLDEEFLLFEAFSKLMGYLQPSEFPTDLLRAALNNHIPFHLLLFQVLKLDIVLVAWLILWAVLSLCLPIAVAASLCCSNNIRRLNEDISNGSTNSRDRWARRMLGYILHVLLFLLLSPIILILASNEQISRSITKLPASANIIYEDINTFLRNTHMQISFVVTSSTDITIDAIRKDLEAVDVLLGKPYQQELATETGIDIALVALEDLKSSASKVSSLVSDLLNECASARIAGSLLQEQLRDIARQLTITRQQCGMKDRALCYTLQYSGFDVSFNMDNLTNDMKIRQLEGIFTEGNFNVSIENARESFAQVPDQVALDTAAYVSDMKTLLSRKRTEVYKSTHALDVLTRTLSETVRVSQETASDVIQRMADWDLWRWLVVLGISSILSLTWGLLLCGAPCGCGLTSRTIPFLLSGVSLSCIICLFALGLGAISSILGGHGLSLICQPLYDQPRYPVLGELLDTGGIFYGGNGIFRMFGTGNDSVKVVDVLRYSQRNQPAYQTFQLYNQINIEHVANHKKWNDMRLLFSNFTVADNNLEILSPSLQLNLQILSTITTANLTTHRLQLSAPITKRDLSSFADQLNTVARQLTDPVSARKIDNLAFVVRKVVHNEMQKLSEIRNGILYRITALEVLLPPLNRQANQSLSHLKTIQYFLDNQGWQIAERTRRQFLSRIESYLEELYDYVNTKVTKELGKCRPLWEIFHSSRFYVCKLIVDPLNGMAFSSFFLILLFLIIAPAVIKLVEHYRETNEDILTSTSHRRSRDGLIIDDEGTWATPSSSTPEMPARLGSPTSADRPVTSTWTSPSPPSGEPTRRQIPPPPRPPSNISAMIHSPRLPQIPSVSRAKSPKSKFSAITSKLSKARNLTQMSATRPRSPRRRRNHESLQLVEPIRWKSGSTTPKSWL